LRQLEAANRVPTTTSSIASSGPDSPNAPVQNADSPPPAAKKTTGKPPAKKPDNWTRDVWKQ